MQTSGFSSIGHKSLDMLGITERLGNPRLGSVLLKETVGLASRLRNIQPLLKEDRNIVGEFIVETILS